MKYFSNGEPEDYNGGRTKADLVSYCENKAESHKPPLELAEMVSQELFDTYCKEAVSLCFISFLPDLRDSGEDGRKKYLKELAEIEEL